MIATSQREMFAAELKRLRRDITKTDKDLARKELNIRSQTTISLYLNGKVRSNETAAKLIIFFKTVIADRQKQVLA